MQFVSGWLVDRFEVNWVIAAGYLVWSLATAATGIVHGFTMLLVMRLMLGIGESVALPSCSKILARHLPEHYRGFANGVLQGAVRCGPAVGTFGPGLVMAKYGWRPVFIGIGLISLAWIPAWMKWMPRGGTIVRSLTAAPGFADIVRQRSFGVLAQATFLSSTSYISCSLGFRFISCASAIFPCKLWRRRQVCTTWWTLHLQSQPAGFQTSGSGVAAHRRLCVNRRWPSDSRLQQSQWVPA